MSFSIREGVEVTKGRLQDEELIAKRFPDAVMTALPNGRQVWIVRDGLEPTDVELQVIPELPQQLPQAILCPYALIGQTRVYTGRLKQVSFALQELRGTPLYERLVLIAQSW